MSGFTAFVYRFSNDESKLTAKSLLCKHVFNSIWQQSNRPIFVDLKWSRSFPIWMPNDTYFFFLRIDITWMIESNFSCKYFWFEAVKVSCKFRSLNIFLNKNIYIFWKLILSLEKLNIVLTGKNRFLFNYNLNRKVIIYKSWFYPRKFTFGFWNVTEFTKFNLYNKKKRMRNEKKEKDNSSNEMIEMFHCCLGFLANSDRMVASFFSSSFFLQWSASSGRRVRLIKNSNKKYV